MADRDALDKEDAIRDYFRKGLTYYEMLAFLNKYHGIEMTTTSAWIPYKALSMWYSVYYIHTETFIILAAFLF